MKLSENEHEMLTRWIGHLAGSDYYVHTRNMARRIFDDAESLIEEYRRRKYKVSAPPYTGPG